MAIELVALTAHDMTRRLREALDIYVAAMHYPPGTVEHRAPMWLDHIGRAGWTAVAADDTVDRHGSRPAASPSADAPMVGIAYGYRGAPEQWWCRQVAAGLRDAAAADLLTDYFELTELHTHPRAQGRGVGEALLRRLLERRTERHVLLSTPEISGEDNRAWRLYRRLGFTDVIREHHFAGDPRPFAVLGRTLPLADAST